MLHGNGFHGRMFRPMSRGLTSGFRCIAVDFPGHGEAAQGDLPRDLQPSQLVEAFHRFITCMGLKGDEAMLSYMYSMNPALRR